MSALGPVVRRLAGRDFFFAAALVVLLLAVNIVFLPHFAALGQWPAVFGQLAPTALIAMATLPSVVSGGLDISLGPLANLVAILYAFVLLPNGLGSPWTAVPICLAAGTLVGAANGFAVAVLRYQPIVATLASFIILDGVNLLIAPSARPVPDNWTAHLSGTIAGVPGGLVLIAVVGLVWFALGRSAFHRSLYAAGGDAAAAYSAGVQVARVRVAAYALGGLIAAVAGLALSGLVQSVDSSYGQLYALIGIAAVAVGGASLRGGRGSLVGALMGACAVYLAQNAMLAAHIDILWVQIVYGAFLILGVVAGALLAAARKKAVEA